MSRFKLNTDKPKEKKPKQKPSEKIIARVKERMVGALHRELVPADRLNQEYLIEEILNHLDK